MEGFAHSHTNSQVSQAKLHSFHTIDRMLYAILVADLLCDPTDAMQIMAFWLWLEQAGFRNVVKRILQLPLMLIDELVHEANICLHFIKNPHAINEIGDIHLTLRLIKDFSFEYLHKNQTLAQSGVKIVCTNICMQAFSDLTQNAILQNEVRKRAQSQQQIFGNQALLPNGSGNGVVPADQRTMFVTFSKGYSVAEWEIREFLENIFGDCIESIYMEDVTEIDDQPLFARIVFYQASMIYLILNGLSKASFIINGKHVRMRKFVPKGE
ncbi:hypothetical protein ACET3Z_028827 [Daucus carota]